MNAEECEESCKAAIDAHVKEGGKILFSDYGVIDFHSPKLQLVGNCGCALSILAKGKDIPKDLNSNRNTFLVIREVLHLEPDESAGFITGFDGEGSRPNDDFDQDWFDAGESVRAYVLNQYPGSVDVDLPSTMEAE